MSVAIAPVVRPGQALPRGVLCNAVELRFAADVDEETWEAAFRIAARHVAAGAWWMGDALVYGEIFNRPDEYGKVREYARAVEITGLAETTLKQYKHVASRFPKGRRRASLPWSHHLEVASLDLDAQEAWLIRAEAEHMTRQELRDALAGLAGKTLRTLVPVTLKEIRREEVDAWRAAAESAGLELSEWLRRLANQAVGVTSWDEEAA